MHVVVQLPVAASSEMRAALRIAGIELQGWIEGTRYYAAVDVRSAAARTPQAVMNGNAAFFELGPGDKLSTHLRTASSAPWASSEWQGRAAVDVSALLFPDVSLPDAIAEIRGKGWGLLSESGWENRITVRIPRDELYELASLDSVKHIQPVAPPRTGFDNIWSAELMESDKVVAAADGVTGKGVKVGIWDGGTVAPLAEFSGRLNFIEPQSRATHATHVAGTLAASGASDPALRGIAPGAILFSGTYYSDVFGKMRSAAKGNELLISQNSWGSVISDDLGNCEMFGDYEQDDIAADTLAVQENLSLVFAVGNPRDSGECALTARGGFYSVGIPASAKNAIAVAAADREPAISTFSGFGPTRDGRLKPDITALGVDVRSWTPTGTLVASGTSMAAPAVSGMLALLIERFQTRQSEPKPKASLLKAVLLNSARDAGNPGPDYVFGYGIPSAPTAIKTVDEKQYVLNTISGGEARHTIPVPGGTGTLRVMLVWSDAPGQPEAATTLVTDLDLSVASGSAAAALPLTLDPRHPEQDAKPGVNRRDNVEQVVIQNPTPGDFTAIVTAFRLGEGTQEYALTWTFEPVAAPPCTTTLSESLLTAPESGGTLPVAVTRSNQCPPGAIENPADWVSPGVSGPLSGSRVVKLQLQENQTKRSRSTMLRIAGKELRINQSGPCTVDPLPASLEVHERLGPLDCIYYGSRAKLYTFEAKAGQTVAIELRSEDFDTWLELLGPNLAMLEWDDDSIGRTDSRIPGPTGLLTLKQSGTYTIVATSYVLREGAFHMKVEFGGPQEAPPAEAYPKLITGCPFTAQGQLTESASADGRRGSLYRTDAYTLQAFAGQRLDVSVREATFDSFVYLISPTGTVQATNDDDPAAGGSRITETLPLGGMWRIEVTSFEPFATGSYRLQVLGCPPVAK